MINTNRINMVSIQKKLHTHLKLFPSFVFNFSLPFQNFLVVDISISKYLNVRDTEVVLCMYLP